MIIVIDGYNLLKHLFPGAKHNLDKQKNSLVRQLAYYKKSKEGSIKGITLVFDAGQSDHATRSVKSEVAIVYSGTKSSADDWILQFVERNRGKEILVVTLDRSLREACASLGADWLDVYSFNTILQQHILSDLQESVPQDILGDTGVEKYQQTDYVDELENAPVSKQALDFLMEQAAERAFGPKAEDYAKQTSPRSKKSYTLSKKEKRIQAKLKKLQ